MKIYLKFHSAIPVINSFERKQSIHLQKELYKNVHASFVHIIQKLELIQKSMTSKMNKQIMKYEIVIEWYMMQQQKIINYSNVNKFNNHKMNERGQAENNKYN